MSLVQAIRVRVLEACLVNRCRREGCSVSLIGAPQNRLIIDCDHRCSPVDRNQEHCDYLFFADENDGMSWFVPMELKRGQINVGKVVRQLQAGARTVESLIPQNGEVRFRPTAAHRGIHSQQRRLLKLRPVHFRGRSVIVRLLPCGAPMTQVLNAE